MKKRKLSKNNKGFTLIEIMIAMAIFGFLSYIITSLLIIIIGSVYNVNQRSYLRTTVETAISTISEDVQFAQDVTDCSASNGGVAQSCISMTVPSTGLGNTSGGVSYSKFEKIYATTVNGLPSIMKLVIINGVSSSVRLNPSNISIDKGIFDLESSNYQQGNIILTVQAHIAQRTNSVNSNNKASVFLSSNIEYGR